MTSITAQTILRSRNASAPEKVLSTLLVRMPRIILAEWNTHRAFSRNAASTRAIPTERLIAQVVGDPFIPIAWGSNKKGMQAGADVEDTAACEREWLLGRDRAVKTAQALLKQGLHKQIVGRVLEPWLYTMVLVSATEWDNFLELRDHPDAEPHIQLLAKEIRKELERKDNIQALQPGEWHLPFMTRSKSMDIYGEVGADKHMDAMIRYSVACAASTSYRTVDGFEMTLERADAIYEKLVESKPVHASPLEHIAQADENYNNGTGNYRKPVWRNRHQHANFIGFRQFRHMIGDAS